MPTHHDTGNAREASLTDRGCEVLHPQNRYVQIIVSPLCQVERLVAALVPERVVGLLDPGHLFPSLGPEYHGRHLRLTPHDVHNSGCGEIAPTSKHIDELLEFLVGWRRSTALLIHCRAGIGRSTAAGFIAACLHRPDIERADDCTRAAAHLSVRAAEHSSG